MNFIARDVKFHFHLIELSNSSIFSRYKWNNSFLSIRVWDCDGTLLLYDFCSFNIITYRYIFPYTCSPANKHFCLFLRYKARDISLLYVLCRNEIFIVYSNCLTCSHCTLTNSELFFGGGHSHRFPSHLIYKSMCSVLLFLIYGCIYDDIKKNILAATRLLRVWQNICERGMCTASGMLYEAVTTHIVHKNIFLFYFHCRRWMSNWISESVPAYPCAFAATLYLLLSSFSTIH